MLTYRDDEGVRYFTEWRLCAVCGRMFNRNTTKHQIAQKSGVLLFAHIECPPIKPTLLKLERGVK